MSIKTAALSALDTASHKALDPYAQAKVLGRWHLPGWGWVQVAQWHLCNATERAIERDEK